MKGIKIMLEMGEMPKEKELMEIEGAGILSIDEVGMKAPRYYIIGKIDGNKAGKWMRLMRKLEDARPISIDEIVDKAFDMYLYGHINGSKADKWIETLTELFELVNTEMEV
jgi:hypothetical protein